MTDWLRESWSYLLPRSGLLGAAIVAIRAVYAAERDREALSRSVLEREKLALELQLLRNSPATVADRRAIYDKLRKVIGDVMSTAAVDVPQIGVLHDVYHDSAFRFPSEITDSLRSLIESAITLYSTNKALARGPHLANQEQWSQLSNENEAALLAISAFQNGLVERFRPHLTL